MVTPHNKSTGNCIVRYSSPSIGIVINRFSVFYGGEFAIATYACISYIMCIIYLILQGVGDGTQPIISKYYGETKFDKLISIRKLAYGFGTLLSVIGCIIMYIIKESQFAVL